MGLSIPFYCMCHGNVRARRKRIAALHQNMCSRHMRYATYDVRSSRFLLSFLFGDVPTTSSPWQRSRISSVHFLWIRRSSFFLPTFSDARSAIENERSKHALIADLKASTLKGSYPLERAAFDFVVVHSCDEYTSTCRRRGNARCIQPTSDIQLCFRSNGHITPTSHVHGVLVSGSHQKYYHGSPQHVIPYEQSPADECHEVSSVFGCPAPLDNPRILPDKLFTAEDSV